VQDVEGATRGARDREQLPVADVEARQVDQVVDVPRDRRDRAPRRDVGGNVRGRLSDARARRVTRGRQVAHVRVSAERDGPQKSCDGGRHEQPSRKCDDGEQDEHGNRDERRWLRSQREPERDAEQSELGPRVAHDEIRGGDHACGDHEVVLRGHRLERDEAQRRREQRGEQRRRPTEREASRAAVDADDERDLREPLRQRGNRVAVQVREGVEDLDLGVLGEVVLLRLTVRNAVQASVPEPGRSAREVVRERVAVVRRRCDGDEELVDERDRDGDGEHRDDRVPSRGSHEVDVRNRRARPAAKVPGHGCRCEQYGLEDRVSGGADRVHRREQERHRHDLGAGEHIDGERERGGRAEPERCRGERARQRESRRREHEQRGGAAHVATLRAAARRR
jgi:hypothetical protein